jgi:L-ascorbate metabolism protein UlaG (beta-lactamase superfamily)
MMARRQENIRFNQGMMFMIGKFRTQAIRAAAIALLLGAPVALAQARAQTEQPAGLSGDDFRTTSGALVIHPVQHASFVMGWNGKTIYVDPAWSAALYDKLPPPDLILITDIHQDHLNTAVLEKLVRPSTKIIAPAAVREKLPEALQQVTQILANGEDTNALGARIEALPMYNLTAERLRYHTKGRGNGYVLTMGGKRVYVAGDTEGTPEMLALKNIDIAFIPMNLPYTMSVEQAAEAVKAFKPKVVYPYHYQGSELGAFARLVGDTAGVEVRQRDWYPDRGASSGAAPPR